MHLQFAALTVPEKQREGGGAGGAQRQVPAHAARQRLPLPKVQRLKLLEVLLATICMHLSKSARSAGGSVELHTSRKSSTFQPHSPDPAHACQRINPQHRRCLRGPVGSGDAVQHPPQPQHLSECLQARNVKLKKGVVQQVQVSTPLALWQPRWPGAAHGWRRGGPGKTPGRPLEAPPEAARPCRACWPRSRASACLRGTESVTTEPDWLSGSRADSVLHSKKLEMLLGACYYFCTRTRWQFFADRGAAFY